MGRASLATTVIEPIVVRQQIGAAMLLFRCLPNLACTPANQEFRRGFYSRWGKENCVISARARDADYSKFLQRLSIKAAWGGRTRFVFDHRTIAVDDDSYFVINDQRIYSSRCHSEETVHIVSDFFRPGLAEETLGALLTPDDGALDRGPDSAMQPVEFAEHLRPHDQIVTPLLRYIASQVDAGIDDEMWFEQQLSLLLEGMLIANRKALAAKISIGVTRQATRREINRRIGWSTDFINTYFMQPLTIADLAHAASLSQFHFIRLFRAVNGITPFAYLQRKRAAVARRLLLSTDLRQVEIAARVGFANQSSIYRHLFRLTGSGARSLRRCDPQGTNGHDRSGGLTPGGRSIPSCGRP